MENPIKYYWIEEEYLEKEVCPKFIKNGFLTAKQFFAIIRWKSPGLGSKPIRDALKDLGMPLEDAVRTLTKRISETKEKEGKLKILLEQRGIRLAIASAILTILYPADFSVYDRRVRSQLKHPDRPSKHYPDISYIEDKNQLIKRYFEEYIPQVKNYNPSLSLRDCDRTLWAKSWNEDLDAFLEG